MPIANVQDAREVERSLQAILSLPGTDGRAQAIRALFVETLDFDHVNRLVPLGAANDPDLPSDARLLFVHFVSRKGWLRFRGDSDYLNALWNNYQADSSQSNFYNGRLEALFFAGLNNPQAFDLMRDNPAPPRPNWRRTLPQRRTVRADGTGQAPWPERSRRSGSAPDNRAVQPLQLHRHGGDAAGHRGGR